MYITEKCETISSEEHAREIMHAKSINVAMFRYIYIQIV